MYVRTHIYIYIYRDELHVHVENVEDIMSHSLINGSVVITCYC